MPLPLLRAAAFLYLAAPSDATSAAFAPSVLRPAAATSAPRTRNAPRRATCP
eukprot:CAMPEP_0194289864 /NCGR_PEP_ID=MMETSP0169-20130528/40037_1 /TAXON_ID=218684 /ORGANISM="Corethron pennatum, Strain L29A3" /LENGTH=51 /DNA_ID=CAMNT_0039037281 /DNA_START=143 /DNA_END=294 /DNA_ORIENTATION=+